MDKPVIEYKYATQKSILIIGLLLFGGGGIFLSYLGLKGNQPLVGGIAIVSFFVCFRMLYGTREKKSIKVFEDKLEIPFGPVSKKTHIVKIADITHVDEVTINNFSSIRILSKINKPILISSGQLGENDYYNLLEYLEKIIHAKPKEYISPLEEKKAVAKARMWRFIATAFPVTLIVGSRLYSNQLQTVNQWLSTLGLILVLVALDYVINKGSHSDPSAPNKNTISLSRRDAKKLKNKWTLLAYSPGIIALGLMFLNLKVLHEGTTNIWPLIVYGVTITIVIMSIVWSYLPETHGVVSRSENYLAYVLNAILVTVSSIFFFTMLNIHLDHSKGIIKKSHFTGEFIPEKKIFDKCYRIAHWETGNEIVAGDSAYCTDRFPGIKDKDLVEFSVKDGFLGVPWISNIRILKYNSINDFLKQLPNEIDLRHAHVIHLSKMHGNKAWKPYLDSWQKSCTEKQPWNCRLASYVLGLDDKKTSSEYVLRGCKWKDFYSCYNFFILEDINESDRKLAKENILSACKDINDPDRKAVCDYVR